LEFTASHQIYYSTKNPIPISQVAESLLALERIIQRSPIVLEKLFDGVKIQKIHAYVERIESGSLTERIIVRFLFGSQEKFDDFVDKVSKGAGMEKLRETPIFPIIIMGIVLSGAMIAHDNWGGPPENRTVIEANNNTIINLGAGMVDMDPVTFRAIVETAVSNRADLARDTVKIIRPAKSDKDSNIVFDDIPELTLASETIRAIPTYLKDDISDESISDYEKVEIEIRAIDLDSLKRGWAVKIPAVHEKRIPLQIDKSIDPEILIGKKFFKGDVTVIFKKDAQGSDIPEKGFLRRLHPDEENPPDRKKVLRKITLD